MKYRWSARGLAAGMAFALCLSSAGLSEELGELDLYDPSIYVDQLPADDAAEGEEAPIEWEILDDGETPGDAAAEGGSDAPAEDAGGDAAPAEAAPEAEAVPEAEAAAESEAEARDAESQGLEAGEAEGERAISAAATAEAAGTLSFGVASLKMGKGECLTLTAQPSDGSAAADITYASIKPGVVSVDGAGNLTAKKTGSAVIGAMAGDGAWAACKVKVVNAPGKVTLSATKLALDVGERRTLKAKLPGGTASQITWASDNEAVVSLDASGNLLAVSPGTATVTARTFNGKKASCKVAVLGTLAPTRLSLELSSLSLGVGEKYQLTPAVGDGESAVFAYASSKKAVAGVSSGGMITAKKAGKATITVATPNGLKAKLKVKVAKAPKKVTLSKSALSLNVGDGAKLAAKLPSGTASAIAWESSDATVASVDAAGQVTALKAGTATIRARTFNKKSALCKVTVKDPSSEAGTITVSVSSMISNLRASSALGSKRTAIANVVELLIKAGFEPAFAAGVGANVYSEGTYGMFESSKYVANYKKRPRYFCYLDGGDYYAQSNGGYTLTAVYLSEAEKAAYKGKAEARLRFGEENFYLNNYSGKYVQDVNLTELEALMETLAEGGWEGKFGLGIVQWTGGRTKTLVSFYRKHAGAGSSTITAAQVVAAENEMILYDLKGGYSGVYASWKSANKALNNAEAARSAGALVCTKYEIPANKESKAVTRGSKAAEIFNIMVGAK